MKVCAMPFEALLTHHWSSAQDLYTHSNTQQKPLSMGVGCVSGNLVPRSLQGSAASTLTPVFTHFLP